MTENKRSTRWEDIYNHLKKKGFEVYSPGQKKGECQRPYIVIKSIGTVNMTEISSKQKQYDILCYVPQNNYSELEKYTTRVKDAMDGLFPMIRPLHSETPDFLDTDVKAHMVSIQYTNYQKKERY